MDPLHVILVNPEIPPNTGNIARLCGATGSTLHLVHPLGFSVDDKAVRRAGLDYWREVDVREHQSFDEALAHSGDGDVFLFSARAERSYLEAPFTPGARLVFGSETKGLPAEVLDRYPGNVYRIPIWGKVRSLNLSTSVGVAVYEAYRKIGILDEVAAEDGNYSKYHPSQAEAEVMGTFEPVKGLPGKIFVPKGAGPKKHPCKGCFNCQWCGDSRCNSCRGWEK